MLTTDTFEKALDLLELGHTFPSITEETGITTEDAEAVHVAWFNRNAGTGVPRITVGWRAGACGDEAALRSGLGRRHDGRRASRNLACLSRTR